MAFSKPAPPKPQWGSWTRWTDCTVTCNTGMQRRRRNCTDFDINDNITCVGQGAEEQTCNNFPCPGTSLKFYNAVLGLMKKILFIATLKIKNNEITK